MTHPRPLSKTISLGKKRDQEEGTPGARSHSLGFAKGGKESGKTMSLRHLFHDFVRLPATAEGENCGHRAQIAATRLGAQGHLTRRQTRSPRSESMAGANTPEREGWHPSEMF